MREKYKIVEIKFDDEFAHYTNEYSEDDWSVSFVNQSGAPIRLNKRFVKSITERD